MRKGGPEARPDFGRSYLRVDTFADLAGCPSSDTPFDPGCVVIGGASFYSMARLPAVGSGSFVEHGWDTGKG